MLKVMLKEAVRITLGCVPKPPSDGGRPAEEPPSVASPFAPVQFTAGATSEAETSAKSTALATTLFERAEMVHNEEYAADERVSYDLMRKLHKAFTEKAPVAFALGEYATQLNVSSGDRESYEVMGKTCLPVGSKIDPLSSGSIIRRRLAGSYVDIRAFPIARGS